MARPIRVVPDALRSSAQRYFAASERLKEVETMLTRASTTLDNAWDGSSSDSALNNLSVFRQEISAATGVLRARGNQLEENAAAYEAIDNGQSYSATIYTKLEPAFLPTKFFKMLGIQFKGSMRVNTLGLMEGARLCNRCVNTLAEVDADLHSTMDTLQANWEGNLFDKFYEKYQELAKHIREFKDNLQMFSSNLQTAAKRYEEAEKSNMF